MKRKINASYSYFRLSTVSKRWRRRASISDFICRIVTSSEFHKDPTSFRAANVLLDDLVSPSHSFLQQNSVKYIKQRLYFYRGNSQNFYTEYFIPEECFNQHLALVRTNQILLIDSPSGNCQPCLNDTNSREQRESNEMKMEWLREKKPAKSRNDVV